VLVLVTALLVLVGLVLLVVGLAHNSLDLIYASIGCTAVAGVVLLYLGRVNRREADRLAHDEAVLASRAGSPPAADVLVEDASPDPDPDPDPDADRTETAGVEEGSDPTQPQSVAAPTAAPAPSAAPTEASAGAAANPDAPIGVAGDGNAFPAGEAAFPIKDYDQLRVGEILPLLRGLDPDELEEVRDRESAGKGRSVILRRVEELLAGDATSERATKETPPSL
jgi:hypothetical protein